MEATIGRRQILPGPSGVDDDSLVSTLIESDTLSWRVDLINTLFSPSEVPHILSLTISRNGAKDTLVWKARPDGPYTVRSGYHSLV